MEVERLVYMANQIARNLELRGHDAAVEETATHISKFWDPRMKATMLGGDRSALSPIAADTMLKVDDYVAAQAA